jgi:hypothetical protein
MRTIVFALFLAVAPCAFGQTTKAEDALVDMVLWGPQLGIDLGIDPAAYPPPLKAAIERYLRLGAAYQPTGPVPSAADFRMAYDARVNYERKLAAISAEPQAPKLAREYVAELWPCYEWEGYHDCPEREATFADAYQKNHSNGPFSAYLPLLAAHRWLCTSEAYIYEKRPTDAEQSRRRYETEIAVARKSELLLVRTAADSLMRRGKCYP